MYMYITVWHKIILHKTTHCLAWRLWMTTCSSSDELLSSPSSTARARSWRGGTTSPPPPPPLECRRPRELLVRFLRLAGDRLLWRLGGAGGGDELAE